MPIKPENKGRYPADWKAIRAEVLERAGHRCEQCKAPNRTLIARGGGSDAGTYMLASGGEVHDAETGEYLGLARGSEYEPARFTEVVLTIAHLDHVPENCGEPGNRPNLKALCQRCHLKHDAQHHAANAQATRRARLAAGDLFAPTTNQ
jgi:5-methylcytosine-specific restriction endonuclease McrA